MPGKNIVKFINSLKLKKTRQALRLFVVEGEKTVNELPLSGFKIHSVYATRQWIEERGLKAGPSQPFPDAGSISEPAGYSLTEVSQTELGRISSLKTPNKVLAVVHIPEWKPEKDTFVNSLSLVLDKIQDPGNLGTLIRSADWFGVDNIILSEDSADYTNPKVVQASMGSVLRVRLHYTSLTSFLKLPEISQMPVYGAFIDAPDIYSENLEEFGLIVLGNESQGISKETESLITKKISIPSPRQGYTAESLNIAVAGSIIMAEFRRRNSSK